MATPTRSTLSPMRLLLLSTLLALPLHPQPCAAYSALPPPISLPTHLSRSRSWGGGRSVQGGVASMRHATSRHGLKRMPPEEEEEEEVQRARGQGSRAAEGGRRQLGNQIALSASGVVPSVRGGPSGCLIQWPGPLHLVSGPVQYGGGLLLTNPITVYFIYYGNWSRSAGQGVLDTFVRSLSSPDADHLGPSVRKWWSIATQYTQYDGQAVSPQVVLGPSAYVGGSYSTYLQDSSNYPDDQIAAVASTLIQQGTLPFDPYGVYFVLASEDVATPGFCSSYCAYHSVFYSQAQQLQYAFVGDSRTQCPKCSTLRGSKASPNGFPITDGMLDAVAHELVETATDPDGQTGWTSAAPSYSSTSYENADLCAYSYTDAANPGVLSDPGQGYVYNVVGLNGYKFLLQANVDINTQTCVIQAQEAPAFSSHSPASAQRWPCLALGPSSFSPIPDFPHRLPVPLASPPSAAPFSSPSLSPLPAPLPWMPPLAPSVPSPSLAPVTTPASSDPLSTQAPPPESLSFTKPPTAKAFSIPMPVSTTLPPSPNHDSGSTSASIPSAFAPTRPASPSPLPPPPKAAPNWHVRAMSVPVVLVALCLLALW